MVAVVCGHGVQTESSSSEAALWPSTMPMTLWVALGSSQETVGFDGMVPSSGSYWLESTQSPTLIALITELACLLRTTTTAIAATAATRITAPTTIHFQAPPLAGAA